MRTRVIQLILTSVMLVSLAAVAHTQDPQSQQTRRSSDISAKCKAMIMRQGPSISTHGFQRLDE